MASIMDDIKEIKKEIFDLETKIKKYLIDLGI